MPIQEPTFGNVELMFMVVITLIVSLIVLAIWNRIAGRRARGAVAREADYQGLAQQATTALAQVTAEQQKIAAGVEELRTRVAAIEAMLREVG
jgi:hypothetical protein